VTQRSGEMTGQSRDNPWVVGETVPWSVAWSAEQVWSLWPDADFPGYAELVQKWAPGE